MKYWLFAGKIDPVGGGMDDYRGTFSEEEAMVQVKMSPFYWAQLVEVRFGEPVVVKYLGGGPTTQYWKENDLDGDESNAP